MTDNSSLCQNQRDKTSKNITVGSTSLMSKKVMSILLCQTWEVHLAMGRGWNINILMPLNLHNQSRSYGRIVYNSCARSVSDVYSTRITQLSIPIRGKSRSCSWES